ncbi:hypothetical protein RI367_006617 [Sorochytrium milnesiophthora]
MSLESPRRRSPRIQSRVLAESSLPPHPATQPATTTTTITPSTRSVARVKIAESKSSTVGARRRTRPSTGSSSSSSPRPHVAKGARSAHLNPRNGTVSTRSDGGGGIDGSSLSATPAEAPSANPSSSSSSNTFDVEDILAHRRANDHYYYLIKWADYDHTYDSWEIDADVLDKGLIDRYWNKYARQMEDGAQQLYNHDGPGSAEADVLMQKAAKATRPRRTRKGSSSSSDSSSTTSSRRKRGSGPESKGDEPQPKPTARKRGRAPSAGDTFDNNTNDDDDAWHPPSAKRSRQQRPRSQSTGGGSKQPPRRRQQPQRRNVKGIVDDDIAEIETILVAFESLAQHDRHLPDAFAHSRTPGDSSDSGSFSHDEDGDKEPSTPTTGGDKIRSPMSMIWTDRRPSTASNNSSSSGGDLVLSGQSLPSNRTSPPERLQYRVIVRWKDGTRSYEDAEDMYRRAGYSMCKFFERHLNFCEAP